MTDKDADKGTAAAPSDAAKAEALAKREAYEKRRAKGEATGNELVWLDEYLEPHGLTISDLLRTVAKNFHGVNIPAYAPTDETGE